MEFVENGSTFWAYEAKYASFAAVVQANDILIEGEAYNQLRLMCAQFMLSLSGNGDKAAALQAKTPRKGKP